LRSAARPVLIAFLDSSFLSFGVVDLLIVWLTIRHPHRMLYYAARDLGSVAGCTAPFAIARKGGEAFLRKRLHERHVELGTAVAEVWPAERVMRRCAPPALPGSRLAAGVAQVRIRDFVLAVASGAASVTSRGPPGL
jgi:membrane protein YqaA with SNARE-associated domain